MTKVTLSRTINNKLYGGNDFESTRLEVTTEAETFEEAADQAKKNIEEWTSMLIKELECQAWGLSVAEWEVLDLEAKNHLADARRAENRAKYHKHKAGIIANNAERYASTQ